MNAVEALQLAGEVIAARYSATRERALALECLAHATEWLQHCPPTAGRVFDRNAVIDALVEARPHWLTGNEIARRCGVKAAGGKHYEILRMMVADEEIKIAGHRGDRALYAINTTEE